MAVRGSTVMQFLPSEVYSSLTPPENPAIGKLWRNEAVIPNELVAWNGKGTSNARSYSVSKNGASIPFDDLSNDDRSLDVLVKTIAPQAGSGVSSPTNVRAISGKSSVTIRQPKNANQLKNLATNGTSSGLTRVVNANGTITITGTASVDYAKVYILPEITGGHFTLDNANFRTIRTAQKNKPIVFKCLDSTGAVVYLTGGGGTNYPMRVIGVYYDYMIADGAVNDTAYPYMELSTRTLTAANYMKYDAVETALTPDTALYGITGYEDEIGNDGHVVHKTSIITFNGTEGWSFDTVNQPLLTTLARFDRVVTGVASNPIGLSSRFPFGAPLYNATTSEMVSGHNSGSRITIYLLKSRLTGWSDALTATEKANLFRTWLSTNNTQVLYQLTTPTIATVAKVDVSGFAGSNIVTSDGKSVTTDYTGSGWDTIGSVQRINIESVSVTNEQGLRVDTLVSGDGTPVPTYFNARGTKYGLFRITDNKLLQGARVVRDGRVLGVTSGMMDPDSDGKAYIDVVTSADGGQTKLRLMGVSFNGAVDPPGTPPEDIPTLDPEQTGNVAGIELGFDTMPAWDGTTYVDEIYAVLRCPGDFTVVGDGILRLAGGNGVMLEGCTFLYGDLDANNNPVLFGDCSIRPSRTNSQYLGNGAYRWHTIYSVNALNTSSDERFKRDMAPIEKAVEFIMDLNPFVYRYSYDKDDAPLRMGVGALQTEKALAKANMNGYAIVDRSNPDELSMAYTELIAPLIATVQQQQQLIEEQGRQLKALREFVGMPEPT